VDELVQFQGSEMWGTGPLLPVQEARPLIFQLASASRLLGMTKGRASPFDLLPRARDFWVVR
jgi:hypothetical protein